MKWGRLRSLNVLFNAVTEVLESFRGTSGFAGSDELGEDCGLEFCGIAMFDNVLQEGGEFISCKSDIGHFPRLTHRKILPPFDPAWSSNAAGRHWRGNR